MFVYQRLSTSALAVPASEWLAASQVSGSPNILGAVGWLMLGWPLGSQAGCQSSVLPSGSLLQFGIENGSFTVDLPIPNGDFPVRKM